MITVIFSIKPVWTAAERGAVFTTDIANSRFLIVFLLSFFLSLRRIASCEMYHVLLLEMYFVAGNNLDALRCVAGQFASWPIRFLRCDGNER